MTLSSSSSTSLHFCPNVTPQTFPSVTLDPSHPHPSLRGCPMPDFIVPPHGNILVHLPHITKCISPQYQRRFVRPIPFSTDGLPGVRVSDLLNDPWDTPIDEGERVVFDNSWRQTTVDLKWPGIISSGKLLYMYDRKTGAATNQTVREVAIFIAELIRKLSVASTNPSLFVEPQPQWKSWHFNQGFDLSDVYIFSMHYYVFQQHGFWVPEIYIRARDLPCFSASDRVCCLSEGEWESIFREYFDKAVTIQGKPDFAAFQDIFE